MEHVPLQRGFEAGEPENSDWKLGIGDWELR